MEGKTNFSRLSGTWIVECLEIVDVGCNPKVRWLDLTDPDPTRLWYVCTLIRGSH